MSSELEYDLRDVLAYIRARVLESQQAYDSLAAGSTRTHDSIDSGSLRSQSSASFAPRTVRRDTTTRLVHIGR